MYSFKCENHTDDKQLAQFEGPGLPPYGREAVVWRCYDAQSIARMLSCAYEAGQRAKEAEIRKALGVVK